MPRQSIHDKLTTRHPDGRFREKVARGRREAEHAVDEAIKHAEDDDPSEKHLDQVGEAVDALEDRTYGDAVELSKETLRAPSSGTLRNEKRISEMRENFERLKRRPYPKDK